MILFFDTWGYDNTQALYANDNPLIPLISLEYMDVWKNNLLFCDIN